MRHSALIKCVPHGSTASVGTPTTSSRVSAKPLVISIRYL